MWDPSDPEDYTFLRRFKRAIIQGRIDKNIQDVLVENFLRVHNQKLPFTK